MSDDCNYLVQGTIPSYRIVKFGTVDRSVVLATAAADLSIGVTRRYKDNAVSGDRVDVTCDDLAEVQLGGTVTRGQALTSDANGKAIAATVSGSRIIGIAEMSGVVDDIIWVKIEIGQFVGSSSESLPAIGNTQQRLGETFTYPVYGGQNITKGSLVAMYGEGVAMPIDSTTLPMGSPPLPSPPSVPGFMGYIGVGVALEAVDNSTGATGAVSVTVKRGCFRFNNNTVIPLTRADIGINVCSPDGHTILSASLGIPHAINVGIIRDVDANGVWIQI